MVGEPCCDGDDGQAYGRGQQHQTAQLFANGDAHLGHVTEGRRQRMLSEARLRARVVVCGPFLAASAGDLNWGSEWSEWSEWTGRQRVEQLD
jgi:hypothetical protein